MILCIAEIRHGKLVPTVFELLTAGRKLADALGSPLAAAVVGGPAAAQAAAEAVAARGAERVYVLAHASLEQFLEEAHALALKGLIEKEKPAQVLLSSSALGRSLAPRLAVSLRTGLASDVTEVAVGPDKHMRVTRPAYGGNLVTQLSLTGRPEMATLRPMAYPRLEASGKKGEIIPFAVDPSVFKFKSRFVSFAPEQTSEVDLSSAEKIVSGGRGLGNAQGFELIRKLAQALGAGVGASRATVDAGWIPYRHQVGLTGRTVRPRLYVACGISGQIQHLAGMSASDVIVAINTDPNCPMMKLANYAVQGDLYEIIPAIIAELARVRGDAPHPAGAAA